MTAPTYAVDDTAERLDRPVVRGPALPPFTALPTVVRRQAALTPDAPAVRAGTDECSYRDLVGRVDAVAAAIADRGVGPGDRVAVGLPHGADLIAALLAVSSCGASFTCLDAAHPPQRRAQIISAFRPSLLVTATTTAFDADTPTLLIDDVADAPARPEPAPPHPSAPAYTLFTSGSTGVPKGVVVGHASLHALLTGMATVVPLGPGDSACWITTPSFDMSIPELFLPLTTGARVVVVPLEISRSPEDFVDLIRREDLTAVQATPTLWRALLATGRVPARVYRLVGAEPVPLSVARELAVDGPAFNLYGPTETTVWSTAAPLHPDADHVSVGLPLPGETAMVLDDSLRPVPPGQDGELYLGGAGLALGYAGRPAETAARFVACPWAPGARMYRTGDRARLDEDGSGITCLGRADDQVKVRGYRLEPGEVEQVLERHDGVQRAVVVAGPHGTGLTAHIVPTADAADRVTALLGSRPGSDRRVTVTGRAGGTRRSPIDEALLGEALLGEVDDLLELTVEGVDDLPDLACLRALLDRAARSLADGGRITLRGVLDPTLARTAAIARRLLRAAPDARTADVVGDEAEHPAGLAVPLSFWNEPGPVGPARLTLPPDDRLFGDRYDVLLHREDGPTAREIRWTPALDAPAALGDLLAADAAPLAITGIPDALHRAVRAARSVAAGDGSVREAVAELTVVPHGVTRGEWHRRATAAGRRAALTPGIATGTTDLLVGAAGDELLPALPHRRYPPAAPPWRTTDPAREHLARDLAPRLRRHVGGLLPGYMVPSAFVFSDVLPLTPNGKVDRAALRHRPDAA